MFLTRGGKHQAPPPPGAAKVTVQASQPQAAILIDDHPCGAGTCQLDLAPGQHRAEARLDGYAPAFATFEIKAGGRVPPVSLAMTPRLPAVVISTNLNQATVAVDQGADQPLQNGEIQLPELAAGQRTIKFKGEGSQAVLSVNAAPATAPRIDLPLQQQSLNATIVSGLGGSAKVFTSLQNASATLDGKPAGQVQPTGLDLTDLTPGSHEIVVTAAQGSPQRVVFDSGPVPAMAVFLGAERNIGMLRITTGQDDVTVYVNGVKTKRNTQSGRAGDEPGTEDLQDPCGKGRLPDRRRTDHRGQEGRGGARRFQFGAAAPGRHRDGGESARRSRSPDRWRIRRYRASGWHPADRRAQARQPYPDRSQRVVQAAHP